jgi:hypothetical protein
LDPLAKRLAGLDLDVRPDGNGDLDQMPYQLDDVSSVRAAVADENTSTYGRFLQLVRAGYQAHQLVDLMPFKSLS